MAALPATLPDDPGALEEIIAAREQKAQPIQKGAQARIIWHDEQKNKTPYSIVYLHGFKASQGEGAPVHRKIAKMFGCNLYLARLHSHGLQRKENFKNFTSSAYLQSAIDACRIGQKIGENIIVMGTSTGAALALHAAAASQCSADIKALVLYSPLIHLYGINSLLFENRITRTFLRYMPGPNYRVKYDPFSPDEEAIWYSSYLLKGALVLGETIQKIMHPSLFPAITCPVFAGYYYKNSRQHDQVTSTSAVKRMMHKLGTPPAKRKLVNFHNAGSHVICSALLSNAVQDVIRETNHFLTKATGLSPVQQL